jgi:hypothetical protein
VRSLDESSPIEQVAAAHEIDLDEVRRWSTAEGEDAACLEFLGALERRCHPSIQD